MKMTNKEYGEYIKGKSQNSPMFTNLLKAFGVGGFICCIGQFLTDTYKNIGLSQLDASSATSVTLIFVGALLTGMGVFDDIAKFAGAGTLVPITGFANSVVAPALEFKAEGFITGTAAKIFIIAGPVITFGIVASVIYGIVLVLFSIV